MHEWVGGVKKCNIEIGGGGGVGLCWSSKDVTTVRWGDRSIRRLYDCRVKNSSLCLESLKNEHQLVSERLGQGHVAIRMTPQVRPRHIK